MNRTRHKNNEIAESETQISSEIVLKACATDKGTDKLGRVEGHKRVYLEAMRIVATFFVIFNHTRSKGFFLFASYAPQNIRFWLYLFMSVFCKFAVFLFFMISGCLLLEKDESIRTLWRKRITKIVLPLVFFSALYYVTSNDAVSLKNFFLTLYKSNTRAHLWFLYSYLAFLISLPLLRSMISNLKNSHFIYLLTLGFFFTGILPVLEYILFKGIVTMNSDLKLSWLNKWIIVSPCVGYFVEYRINIRKVSRYLPLLWLANVLLTLLICYLTYTRSIETGVLKESKSQTFFKCFSIPLAATIFLTIKYFFTYLSIPDVVEKWIVTIGHSTFGIYLIHLLIRDLQWMQNLRDWLITQLSPMPGILVFCLLLMILSCGVTIALSKMPIIRKLVGY